MKVEKFKVLLYLKKSGTDKSGKAPIMGRITVNRTMAQFGCKLSCRPDLWNARESRLDGKSREELCDGRERLGGGHGAPLPRHLEKGMPPCLARRASTRFAKRLNFAAISSNAS